MAGFSSNQNRRAWVASQRRPPTLLHKPHGEVKEDEVHVEIRIEYVSKDGKKTVSLHRVIRYSEYERATIASLRDWEILIKETSREVPKDFHTDLDTPSFISLDD